MFHPMQLPLYSVGMKFTNGPANGDEMQLAVHFAKGQGTARQDVRTLPPWWRRFRWCLARIAVMNCGMAGTAKLSINAITQGTPDTDPNPDTTAVKGILYGLQVRDGDLSGDFQDDHAGVPLHGVGSPFAPNLPLAANWDGRLYVVAHSNMNANLSYDSATTTPSNVDRTLLPRYRMRISVCPLVRPDGTPYGRAEEHPLDRSWAPTC